MTSHRQHIVLTYATSSRFSRLLPYLCLLIVVFTFGYILGIIQSSGLCLEKCEVTKTSAQDVITVSKHFISYFVVIIFSSPKYLEKRNTIRKTWLSRKDNNKILHFFVIGTATLKAEYLYLLRNEEELNHDLMLLPNVADSYSSLSEKLLEGFHWVNENVNYTFLLKVDDDSFVNLDQLLHLAAQKQQSKLFWGFFDGRAWVKRSGKWSEKNWFLCDHYLPYAKGGGYVLSNDLVQYVVQNSKLLSLYKNEDVSLGTWLAPLSINRIHDLRFDTEYRSQGCDNSFVVTHKQSLSMMEEKHNNLITSGNLCSHEFRNSLSYVYNWHVAPSKCCTRNVSVIQA